MAVECIFCGEELTKVQQRVCPFCGATLPQPGQDAGTTPDPREQRIYKLLARARRHQRQGQIEAGLRAAREALSLRPECSSIHALLGQLYEQDGNATAARYHFQAALDVTSPSGICATGELPASPDTPANGLRGAWMTLILIGCILFSGVAAIYTFWPDRHPAQRGSVLQTQMERSALPHPPAWNWVPSPGPQPALVEPHPKPVSPTAPVTPKPPEPAPVVMTSNGDASPIEPLDEHVEPGKPLGPSARERITAQATKPTIDLADGAYFRGEYAQAATMYEELLAKEDFANPRLYQDLAWCYQQLGNSEEAAEHLKKANAGYQAILATDPNNAAALEGMKRCELHLHSLLRSRDQLPEP